MVSTQQSPEANSLSDTTDNDNVFFRILDDQAYFNNCLDKIEKLLFPREEYQAKAKQELPDQWIPEPDKRMEAIDEKFKEFIEEICKEEELPFLSYFHKLFLQRRWNIPYIIPRQAALDLVRLQPDQPDQNIPQSESANYNYSKYSGDYNHFVNVVAALARLIVYFQNNNNVKKLVKKVRKQSDSFITNQVDSQEEAVDKEVEELAKTLQYQPQPDLRKFKLILAGFYHDIGKTIQNARHAMEGAIIIESHTTEARYKLHQLIKKVNSDWKFDRDDLLFISNLVLYHDQYGTLSTGEDGYLQLVDVIDCIHRYSLKESSEPGERLEWSHRYLFDLWLLNVADIMVSLKDKWELQKIWKDPENAENAIESFLFNKKNAQEKADLHCPMDDLLIFLEKADSDCLMHDLEISLELLDKYCCQRHLDDLVALKKQAHKLSLQHVVERLRRLMISTLRKPIDKYSNKEYLMLENISDEEWNSTIVRAIEAIGNREEFSRRFSWLKKSDYALGFFEKIAEQALEKIKQGDAKGWTYEGSRDNLDSNDGDDNTGTYFNKTQAQFIADNYVTTVIQILGHLLFREPSLDSPRNVEFSDATKRLTETKINQILSFEGPSRARKSIDLILQTIYVY